MAGLGWRGGRVQGVWRGIGVGGRNALIERPSWQNIDGLDREKTERRVLPVKQETV